MSDDVLITPASRKIEFKDNSGNVDGKIELDSSGNLKITSPGGGLELGDAASDIYVGNGSANIDIIFEQNGEIRGTTGRTLTLGQSDSNIAVNALNFTSGGNAVLTTGNADAGATTTNYYEADHVLINDGGVLKKIDPDDLNIPIQYGFKFNSYLNGGYHINGDPANQYTSMGLAYRGVAKFTATSSLITLSDDTKIVGSLNINNAYTFPTSDGSANQVLQTNGNGTLSFAAASGGTAADDITAGDAAVNLTTTSGDITIDTQGNGNDLIFKGTSTGGSDIEALRLDMSNSGSATFNAHVYLKDNRYIGLGSTALNASSSLYDLRLRTDGTRGFIEAMNTDSGAGLTFKSDDYLFQNRSATATFATLTSTGLGVTSGNIFSTSNNITIDAQGGDTDIIFKGTDGSTDITFLTLDGSDRGVLIPGSGSETSHRLQVGSKIAMFDDGNAHLHSLGGTFWINANSAASVRINNQQNGDVILTNGTGKVGIGTDAPNSPLHVVGNVEVQGSVLPTADDTYDLGSSSKQWRDIYTGDINLNNTKTRDNEVDGTRGSWTIQEGVDDLFLLNRLNGKKYKFKLEEMK